MGRRTKTKRERKLAETSPRAVRRASGGTFQRLALGTWFAMACLLAAAGAYSHFGQPVRVKLGANLGSFDRLQFTYGGKSKDHISPLCGCWKEQAAETWRGVSFAARRLTLSRRGPSPLTAYVITAPWPAEIFAGGPWLALPSKSFGPLTSSFDPVTVLEQFKSQALPSSASNFITSVQYAILVTDQPLHIHQFGDTPFGAWIPMGPSTIAIRPQLALFPTSANIVDVQESYREIRIGTPRQPRTLDTIYSNNLNDKQSNAEVPALELLGKRTVLWTEGPHASVWLEHGALTLGQAGSAVGLVIDPVFSARVAVIPTSREALSRFAKIEKEQILPQPQDWLGVSETGLISLRLERTIPELQEFDKVTERLKTHDTIDGTNVEYPMAVQLAADGNDGFFYETHSMKFRYPPSPARGFNVFGTMTHLTFEGATGSVVLGSRIVDIPAPSTVEFRDIESFKAARGLIPIAVREGTEAFDTTLTFSGVSEAWLNGEPLTRLSDRFSWSLGFFAMIAGIVQAIAAGFGMATIIFSKRRV